MYLECEEVKRKLSHWVDSPGGDLPSEVREHLDGCSSCCVTLEEYKELDQNLSSLQSIKLPEDVHQSLVESIETYQRRWSRWRSLIPEFRLSLPRLAFAGSLVVVVASLLLLAPWREIRTVYEVVEEELVKPGYDHAIWKIGVDRFVDDVTVRSAQYARQELDFELDRMSTRTVEGIFQTVGNIQLATEERR
jgi:hypothetical protein